MKEKILLFLIIFVAIVLRFWQVTIVPPSLTHDEVAIGYNAYSIYKTGKDEYGEIFPLLFRSFDDYKLPGMVYATIPSIAIFGLNEFGVRFPSAFLGSLTVLVFYFLVKELQQLTQIKKQANIKHLPLFATFFFAISIWHVNFSRQLFESNGSLFFLVLGTYFLLVSKRKIRYLFFAALFYAVSLYFYYSVRLILPFILLTFVITQGKYLIKHVKTIFLSLLFGVIILLPLTPAIFSSGGFSRVTIVSILNDEYYVKREREYASRIAQNNTIFTRIIYNRRIALAITVAENYLKNISAKHIFLTGTSAAGLLYLFEAPFFFLGIYYLLRLQTSMKWVIIAWLLSAPLAGAFTVNQPNSLRTLPNAPIFALLSGLGFTGIFTLIKQYNLRAVFLFAFFVVFLIFFSRFADAYFYTYPKMHASDFGDGYKQMIEYVKQHENTYKAVYISGYYWRPYIFTLFWKNYNPAVYQKEGSIDHLGKYYFSAAEWDKDGIYFGLYSSYDVDFYSLVKTNSPQETLFILARPEFEKYREKFNKIAVIDGRFTEEVFIVAVLK